MLDPQLVCYSWVTGIADVAQVVFVRKRLVEIQYLRTTISDGQREEFGHLVQDSLPLEQAAGAIELSDGIHVGNEVVLPAQRLGEPSSPDGSSG